jgi:rifampicin phosphotransferase
MSTFVLTFSDPNATLENVGGKGMSLAKLTRAGLPVPGGFHITTEAYRRFVSENGIQPRILEALKGVDALDPATLEPVSQAIGRLFAEGRIPTEITEAVTAAYDALRPQTANDKPSPTARGSSSAVGTAVAVRSSATAEDLPGASFAGQQDTYLNICGTQAVLNAVKRCWASLWTARAIAYRARQGIDPDTVALAVVVQKLVFAEAAGVMFTANPINGKRNEIMITAAWGLGEAVVSGAVTPDTLTVEKAKGKLIQRETSEKQVMTVRTESGTSEVSVPDSKKKKAVLTNKQAAELTAMGRQIEQLYEMPMDIEWTWTPPSPIGRGAGGEGGFAIVQARPITSLPLGWVSPHPKAVLARGSFAEFLPDPVSPLFATLAVPIALKASREMMKDFAGIEDPESYLFAVVNGYVYIGMMMTPKFIWMYTVATFTQSKKMLTRGKERWLNMREKYLAVADKWQARDVTALTARELLAGVREIFTMTAEYYSVVQSSVIPAASSSEISFCRYYDSLVKRKDDPEATTFLFGLENQPLRAEKSLFDLAMWVKEQAEIAAQVKELPAVEICQRLEAGSAGWDEFRARFAAHLAEFGHAIYDLDFAKSIPVDDPAPRVEALKMYMNGGGSNPYERQGAAVAHSGRAADAIAKRLDGLRRKWFLKLLKWAKDTAPFREDGIADLGLGYPQIRRLLGEVGRRFTAGGAIAAVDDIYWLEIQEVDALAAALEMGEVLSSHAPIVEQRKAHWQLERRASPPLTIPEKSWISKLLVRENPEGGNSLKGFGVSAGKVTARACVMLGPEDFNQMRRGDVIVAVTTTPAWTPLFALASAVVTDIGGPLSHSSIVAREYGIPAVLAAGAATRRIQTGQMVTVDGSAGLVTLVE